MLSRSRSRGFHNDLAGFTMMSRFSQRCRGRANCTRSLRGQRVKGIWVISKFPRVDLDTMMSRFSQRSRGRDNCTGFKKKKKNPLRNTGWRTVLNKPISWSQLCRLCTTRQAEVDLTDLILVKKA